MCTLLVGRKGPTKLQYLQTEKKKDIIYDSSQKCWKIWILKKTSHQFLPLQQRKIDRIQGMEFNQIKIQNLPFIWNFGTRKEKKCSTKNQSRLVDRKK